MLQEDAQILLDVLRRQASKVPDRTVIVLDGYVDDTAPTSLLPEIIRVLTDASPICQLVVMIREVTHLETFGAVFIDSLLVMPQALRATAGDVVEFGARRGVDLSSEQGEEIVRLTGGWPAMAAMVALQARHDSRGGWFFDDALDDVAGIFEHEVSQLRDSLKLRVTLASMFLPVLTPVLVDRILGKFGERISTLLTSLGVRVVPDSSRWVHGRSERDVTRALEHLVEDGYLRVLDEEAETRAYVRVPVIDQVTKRWFAQVDVAFSGPLVELTCQVMVGQGLALEAAEQCVDHSRWEGFASFVDDNWYELLEADPTRLLTVLAKVPLSVGEASDKLSIINRFLDAERRAQAARPGGVLARLGVQGRAQEEGGVTCCRGLLMPLMPSRCVSGQSRCWSGGPL